jgi:hypothetical protein
VPKSWCRLPLDEALALDRERCPLDRLRREDTTAFRKHATATFNVSRAQPGTRRCRCPIKSWPGCRPPTPDPDEGDEREAPRAPTRPPPTTYDDASPYRWNDPTRPKNLRAPLSTRLRPRAPPRPRPAASVPPPWRGRCPRASAARTPVRRASPISRGTPGARSSGRRPCRPARPRAP